MQYWISFILGKCFTTGLHLQFFFSFLETGSWLSLHRLCDPPASTSLLAGVIGVYQHAQLGRSICMKNPRIYVKLVRTCKCRTNPTKIKSIYFRTFNDSILLNSSRYIYCLCYNRYFASSHFFDTVLLIRYKYHIYFPKVQNSMVSSFFKICTIIIS